VAGFLLGGEAALPAKENNGGDHGGYDANSKQICSAPPKS
jgi:hypothetical protein